MPVIIIVKYYNSVILFDSLVMTLPVDVFVVQCGCGEILSNSKVFVMYDEECGMIGMGGERNKFL